MKKLNKSLQDDATKKLKKDKIWCQDGGHYQYVEVCEASCKKIHKCEAYADYHEPMFI